MRREFQLTREQKDYLLNAMKPVVYMIIGGHPPRSLQENANEAWRFLGEELGFDYMSVRPVVGKSDDYFTAEVKP